MPLRKTLLFAGIGGASCGLWLLFDILLRLGPALDRTGVDVTRMIALSAGLGAAAAIAVALGARLVLQTTGLGRRISATGPMPPALGVGAASTALTALFFFWWLRDHAWVPAGWGMLGRVGVTGAVAILVGVLTTRVSARAFAGEGRGCRWAVLCAIPGVVAALVLGATAMLEATVEVTPSAHAESGLPVHGEPGSLQRIYVITIDALCADRLSCYGSSRKTSPRIDALARAGTRFETCFAQGNRTEISFGSILTGLNPASHGITRVDGRGRPLSEDATTLAELLDQAGYVTVGALSSPHLKRGMGLDQGFTIVDEFPVQYRQLALVGLFEKLGFWKVPDYNLGAFPRAPCVTDHALAMLRPLRDQRVFALIHYLDVHHPYLPPPELLDTFRSPGASDTDPLELFGRVTTRGQTVDTPGLDPLPPSEILRLSDLYDEVIAFTDREIGRLLDGLDEAGMLENALVVLLADHGDEFGEHGYLFHANPVPTEPLTRVPLVFWAPGRVPAETVIDESARQIDVLPTVLAMAGLPVPESVEGRVLPIGDGEASSGTPPAISEGIGFSAWRESRDGHLFKLGWDRGAQAVSLFDLGNDPGEIHDVSSQWPALTRELTVSLLTALHPADPLRSEERTLDPSLVAQLKSLGYIGNAP
ncbi:MAG: sulfatase [Candidatus Eisenbacteria bacterium]